MRRLSSFENLGAGTELPVLPASSEALHSEFVEFPDCSDGLQPTRVAAAEIKLPRFSLFEFERVTLHGFRLFETGSSLFNDSSLPDETGRASEAFWAKFEAGQKEDLQLGADGKIRSRDGDAYEVDAAGSIVLASDEPSNFGSWIFRILPKFLLAHKQTGLKKVFVYNNSRWMLPILKLVCSDVEVRPHWPEKSYHLNNPLIPSLPSPHVFLRAEIQNAMDSIIQSAPKASSNLEKIYVSRRKQAISRPGLRVLENETELVERLRTLGFTEVFPEEMPIADQVSMFSSAKIIVSPGGSNLFGCVFAREAELILDIESGPTWRYAHMNLLSSTCRPFSMVTGVQTNRGGGVHRNWTVDIDCLLQGLRRLGV